VTLGGFGPSATRAYTLPSTGHQLSLLGLSPVTWHATASYPRFDSLKRQVHAGALYSGTCLILLQRSATAASARSGVYHVSPASFLIDLHPLNQAQTQRASEAYQAPFYPLPLTHHGCRY
jgi:hypothetical protein